MTLDCCNVWYKRVIHGQFALHVKEILTVSSEIVCVITGVLKKYHATLHPVFFSEVLCFVTLLYKLRKVLPQISIFSHKENLVNISNSILIFLEFLINLSEKNNLYATLKSEKKKTFIT